MSSTPPKPDWAMNRRERARAEALARGEAPARRRRWPWVLGGLVLVAALGAGGYALRPTPSTPTAADLTAADAAPARATMRLAPFEVTTLAPTTLRDTLRITGSLKPVRQAQLSSEVTGRVLEVAVRAGDAVSEGQVLVTFDTEVLTSQLAQATATTEATRVQLAQARADFERTENLTARGLAAPTALDKARSALDQLTASLAAQETQVANARRSLERATLTAPFAGFVAARSADPGAFVATGSPLVTLVDLTRLELEATAPIAASPLLTPGLAVEVSVEGFGERGFAGQVARLGPVALEGSRMLPVYVTLDNSGGALRGGMFAAGKIVIEEKPEGLGLPAGAIRHDAEGSHVLVVEDGLAARRAVETGREWDGGAVVEIVGGLTPGELVVIQPLPELEAGTTVELEGN